MQVYEPNATAESGVTSVTHSSRCASIACTSAPLLSFPDGVRSLLDAARACPCCSLLPWRTSDAQTTNCCLLCVFPVAGPSVFTAPPAPSDTGIFLPFHPSRLRRRASTPSCCSVLAHLALATLRPGRRRRSSSSFSSSRARSRVKHGRKGLWFHRRCRGKWSCQKGLLRRHLY